MLELFSSGLMSVWLDMAGIQSSRLNASQEMVWPGHSGFVLPAAPEPATASTVQQYLKELSKTNPVGGQGVWMQSGPVLLANNQGTVPLPAASLTKIATSLAALSTWEYSHQFETLIGATGPIRNGVLQGDLVITGNGDPLFVWEEAIAVGNALNRLGIKQVSGNLVIRGNFAMNYNLNPAVAGEKFKQAINSRTWPRFVYFRYFKMRPGTPRPEVAIAGGVKVESVPPGVNENSFLSSPRFGRSEATQAGRGRTGKQILLLRHRSLTLAQILKQMNIFSNNEMAEMLAESLGGAEVVRQRAAIAAGVPMREILLVNGSGLGVENRISPRAACAMLMAIHNKLQPLGLTIGDLFPVSGRDKNGTMVQRKIPEATVVKTGTLRDVSALAGVMPTRDRGLVWFAIVNRGGDVLGFRAKQDQLLQSLSQRWGMATSPPAIVLPTPASIGYVNRLGAAERNQIFRMRR